eukprot:3391174-Rhodomonas_salina.1
MKEGAFEKDLPGSSIAYLSTGHRVANAWQHVSIAYPSTGHRIAPYRGARAIPSLLAPGRTIRYLSTVQSQYNGCLAA